MKLEQFVFFRFLNPKLMVSDLERRVCEQIVEYSKTSRFDGKNVPFTPLSVLIREYFADMVYILIFSAGMIVNLLWILPALLTTYIALSFIFVVGSSLKTKHYEEVYARCLSNLGEVDNG